MRDYDFPPEVLEQIENGGTVIVDQEDCVLVATDRPAVIEHMRSLDMADSIIEDTSSGMAVFKVKASFDHMAAALRPLEGL